MPEAWAARRSPERKKARIGSGLSTCATNTISPPSKIAMLAVSPLCATRFDEDRGGRRRRWSSGAGKPGPCGTPRRRSPRAGRAPGIRRSRAPPASAAAGRPRTAPGRRAWQRSDSAMPSPAASTSSRVRARSSDCTAPSTEAAPRGRPRWRCGLATGSRITPEMFSVSAIAVPEEKDFAIQIKPKQFFWRSPKNLFGKIDSSAHEDHFAPQQRERARRRAHEQDREERPQGRARAP